MGFKSAKTRAGFFEKLRQQGKFKEGVSSSSSSSAPGIPKIKLPKASTVSAPVAPKAPSVKAPKAPAEIALMNLAKPTASVDKLKDLMATPKMPTEEKPPEIEAPRFKKLKRIF